MPIMLLAAAAWAVVGGCTSAPAPPAFPTLGEMAPAEAIRSPVAAEAAAAPRAGATVTRLVLPLGVSLEAAWAEVDEDVLPPLTRGVWRANGLRCGVLRGERLPAFLDGLPPVWADRDYAVVGGGERLLRRSPPLIQPVFADLTVPPYAPRREELLGDRAALLGRFAASGGGLSVTLTPLHQRPTRTLRARSASEKERSGRPFEELALRLTVPRGGYAVVGLARAPGGLPTAAEIRAEGGEKAAEDAEDALPVARIAPPPLPPHLGRALFTLPAERRGDPQVLLVISPAAR